MSAIDELEISEEEFYGAGPDTSGDLITLETLAEADLLASRLELVRLRRAEYVALVEAKRAKFADLVAKFEERTAATLAPFDSDIRFYEDCLVAFHRAVLAKDPERAKIPLTSATLKKSHGGVSWKVQDEEALVAWADANMREILADEPPPEEPKPKLNRNNMKKHLKEVALAAGTGPQRPRFEDGKVVTKTGDVVPGLVVVADPDKFEVILD